MQALNELVASLDSDIAALSSQQTVYRHLLTIPGVGPLIAAAFISEVDAIQFSSGRELSAWCIKDVFKYEIVGYTIGERMTQKLTGQALCMALRNKCPPVGSIHHSNRSTQYCTQDYRVIQQNRV